MKMATVTLGITTSQTKYKSDSDFLSRNMIYRNVIPVPVHLSNKGA